MNVDPSNAESAQGWDGPSGDTWTDNADLFDRGVAAYLPAFLSAIGSGPLPAVLDVGCGSGPVARAVSHRSGRVTGIDLSARQLDLARRRSAEARITKIEYVQADAQIADLGQARYDRVISRNGVQFFGDPAAAFANLARALRPGGRLVLLFWQDYDQQEWSSSFRTAVGAPPMPGAGPFVFGEQAKLEKLLVAAGFVEPTFRSLREPMWFGADADAAERMALLLVGGFIEELPEAERPAARERLRADVEAHAGPAGVAYSSAMWLVTASL